MCRLLLHLLAQLVLIRCSLQLQCTPPYNETGGTCVYIGYETSISTWCDAAKYCKSINGELLLNLDAIRAVRNLGSAYYFGVTDLLVERGTARDGWMWTNGSIFPTLNDSDWASGMPNNAQNNDDFLGMSLLGLRDRNDGDEHFLCQPIVTPNSEFMRRSDFLRLGNISPSYCYTDAAVSTELQCLWLCVQRWECRAALFNRVSVSCRMLDFADSSVGDVIENDPDWVKFVKSYD